MTELNSYAAVLMYSFVASGDHGKGVFLGGTLGSSVKGTHTISDNYEAVGFTTQERTEAVNISCWSTYGTIRNYIRKRLCP